ncbi:unnamed protein product [Schistosoma margrebowiei]|uniref:Uncharacterized protein n=1 Tax=Schistosoma margrebowiei TaxID=48269 RepID=A0A183LAC8_9TREM|nr:unnamed protein product [Schistosoma margrebowiei]
MESSLRHLSSYLGLISWIYLHRRVDVHYVTRTQYRSLQTPSRYPTS